MAGMQTRRSTTPWGPVVLAIAIVGLVAVGLPLLYKSQQVAQNNGATNDLGIETGLPKQPLRRRSGGAEPRFMRLTSLETGVEFTNVLDEQEIWSNDFRPILNGSLGSGTCVADFDNDGHADLYFVGRQSPNQLFRQIGDLHFEDVTHRAGVNGGEGTCAGASFVDIDNDGDLDLYLCKYDSPNSLYLNQGDGTFIEDATSYGLDFQGSSVMPAFSDYDRDGDLDLFLVTNRLFITDEEMQQAKRRISVADGQPVIPKDVQELMYFSERRTADGKTQFIAVPAGQRDRLFRNEGNGTFRDVAEESGIHGCFRGHSAIWWDFDNDNWPDLYIANDFYDPDQLYHNNGDGTFTEVTPEMLPHTPWYSMGSDSADINNDGRFDLLATDMSATTHFKSKLSMGSMSEQRWFLESAVPRQYMRNALYLNTGTDRFMEVAYLAGMDSTDWTWSAKFCDMDNDGHIDAFFTNGMIRNTMDSDLRQRGSAAGAQRNRAVMRELLRDSEPLREANITYRNLGDLRFENVGRRWGLDQVGISCSAVFADLDNDGDQDLVVNNYNEPVSIYRNQGNNGHAIRIRLRGTLSNRFGVGAVAKIETENGMQVRRLALDNGYMSSRPPELHFGLGETTQIDRLTLSWPSGHVQQFKSLAADHVYEFHEPPAAATAHARSLSHQSKISDLKTQITKGPNAIDNEQMIDERPMFIDVSKNLQPPFKHVERDFDDFAAQPLLPYRLSRLGAGVACGDVDGDGDDDVFLAGAAGQSGRLYLNDKNTFIQRNGPWQLDRECEDMTPLWLDADSDADLDLFVTSGGVETKSGDSLLRDRLYLNNGDGEFRRAARDALPDIRQSTGAAAAADFDRDGDLDLFVGGRVIPGEYPLSPPSTLLRNENGRFVDITDQIAAGLREAGLVTGALWSDVDDDGHMDLLITVEWGPIRLFRNAGGTLLIETTREAGLADRLGWWNGITGGDLDSDGDIDYVATNLGWNTKYHAGPDHPAVLYYGDLDAHGHNRIIEAKFEDERLLPVRGRSCSTSAMPSLAARFPTYHEFASAELRQIYSPQRLVDAYRVEANTFDTVVLINDGKGRFSVHPLPTLAQASPGYGVAICDFDGDGWNDVYLVQNSFAPQPETGHMNGGLSMLLRGDGMGGLLPVDPAVSGLVVSGDTKGLATLDTDRDGWADLVIGQNNRATRLMRHTGMRGSESLAIRLRGPTGNPSAVGARVKVRRDDGRQQAMEVYAGSGYLSQSAPVVFIGRGASLNPVNVSVRWPDGYDSEHSIHGTEEYVTLSRPP